MSAGIYGLLGALIGAAASIFAMAIQQRYQNRRDLIKLASELAIDDYNRRIELAKKENMIISFPPITAFVAYQLKVLEAMSAGTFNEEKIKALNIEQEEILKAFKHVNNK